MSFHKFHTFLLLLRLFRCFSINKLEDSDSVSRAWYTHKHFFLSGDIEVNKENYIRKKFSFSEKCKCDCLNKL